MLKLRKSRTNALRSRVVGLAAAVGLMAGLGVATAPSASATSFVCNYWGGADGSKCQHQSSFHTGLETGPTNWYTADEKLSFQPDGNLVIYCNNGGTNAYGNHISAGQPIWATNSEEPWYANWPQRLDFWTDGNLALYTLNSNPGYPAWQVTWNTQTWAGSDSWAVLQADGNFVIWEGGHAMWASNTYHVCPGTEDYWNGYQ